MLAIDFPNQELSDEEIVAARELDVRLNDVYFKMPDIREALGYAKELITHPNCDTFRRVLNSYFIPFRILQWDALMLTEPEATEPKYECSSHPFVDRRGNTYNIRIAIWCLEGPEKSPKF